MANRRRKSGAETAGASTAETAAATPPRPIDAVIAGLRAKHPGRVCFADEYTMPWSLRRLPFGIVDLDIATGGGIPGGGISMLVGKPSEGKNFVLNLLIKKQQEIYGEKCAVAVIGTELPYDKSQGRSIGVKVSLSTAEIEKLREKRRLLREPDLSTEEIADLRRQIGTFIVVPPSTAEAAFDIAVDLVRSGEFNIVALDSFGSILPEDEVDQEFSKDSRVAAAATLNTRLVRKLTAAWAPDTKGRPNLTAFVGINQVRDKQKAQAFEKQTKESGGWSLQHGRFLTVELARTEYIRDEGSKAKVAKTISWEITKQKAGGHEGYTGQYVYLLDKCAIDEGELLLRLGVKYGLIEKVDKTYSYSGGVLGVGAARAANGIVALGLVDEITAALLDAAGVVYVT